MSISPENLHERVQDTTLLELRLNAMQEDVILPMAHRSSGFNSYQQEAVSDLRANFGPDQVIDLPTRSGKSFLIREIARQAQSQGLKAAIISHRKHILDEHASELELMGATTQNEYSSDISITMLSTHSVAVGGRTTVDIDDHYDLVLVDEAHRALGRRTVEEMRALFPNTVRIAFTATPDFAENKSVTDEYGETITSKSVVEGIQDGINSPVRAFIYKTKAVIDNKDPNVKDFTPRELARIARFQSRNTVITDMAHDLVIGGRQGLISTVPGHDLKHARHLAELLTVRTISDSDGNIRNLKAKVVQGHDNDKSQKLRDFEEGKIDVLLFCDVLTEGFTTKVATFFINGRPTTSMVNLTQQMGRVMEPKQGLDAVLIDFVDSSKGKTQRTLFDVLELDRSVQGVRLRASEENVTDDVSDRNLNPQEYLSSLFRSSIIDGLLSVEGELISELTYPRVDERQDTSEFELYRINLDLKRRRKQSREMNRWERILEKEGMPAEHLDEFGVVRDSIIRMPDSGEAIANGDLKLKTARTKNDLQINSHHESYTDRHNCAECMSVRSARATERFEHTHQDRELLRIDEVLTSDKLDNSSEMIREQFMIVPPAPAGLARDYEDVAAAQEQVSVEDVAIASLSRHNIHKLVGEMSDERDKNIITERFGLLDGNPATLVEIGDSIGLSSARISQLELRALARLRHAALSYRRIRPFSDGQAYLSEAFNKLPPYDSADHTYTMIPDFHVAPDAVVDTPFKGLVSLWKDSPNPGVEDSEATTEGAPHPSKVKLDSLSTRIKLLTRNAQYLMNKSSKKNVIYTNLESIRKTLDGAGKKAPFSTIAAITYVCSDYEQSQLNIFQPQRIAAPLLLKDIRFYQLLGKFQSARYYASLNADEIEQNILNVNTLINEISSLRTLISNDLKKNKTSSFRI
jgi:superfamily II DNA or RNA helicase